MHTETDQAKVRYLPAASIPGYRGMMSVKSDDKRSEFLF